jgi:predicted enzyme related to lactoylglutathione lyase
MNTPILWIEIPVADIHRSIKFYENVLNTKMEPTTLFETQMALFKKEVFGMKGSFIQTENYSGSNGIKPIVFIDIMLDAIENVTSYGDKVIKEPTLLRQKNKNGDIIIGTNLIDGQVGYYSEILYSEGNHLYLYSHS